MNEERQLATGVDALAMTETGERAAEGVGPYRGKQERKIVRLEDFI